MRQSFLDSHDYIARLLVILGRFISNNGSPYRYGLIPILTNPISIGDPPNMDSGVAGICPCLCVPPLGGVVAVAVGGSSPGVVAATGA